MFEAFAPFIICLSLMPLIVKARVSYAYAHTVKLESKKTIVKSMPNAKVKPETEK